MGGLDATYLILVSGATAIVGIAASASRATTRARGPRLAPRAGRMPARLGGTPLERSFVSDPSGGFSRTIVETGEDPNFKIIIRDFSFPPDRQNHIQRP
jgi:hypothetical protein